MSTPPRAAYVHIPFCRRRCGYCNFAVVAGREDLHLRYLDALEKELQRLAPPHEVDTLYLGGGTPTQLTDIERQRLCRLIRHTFPVAEDYEWTIEANPAELTLAMVRQLAGAGINRVSLGVQSFADQKLAVLQRDHRQPQILAAFQLCREHFASVALDLIFAAPGESLADWQADLDQVVALAPDHISIYGLTYEKGTHFWARGDEERFRSCLTSCRLKCTNKPSISWNDAVGSTTKYPISLVPVTAAGTIKCIGGDKSISAPGRAARFVDGVRETNHRSTFTYIRRLERGLSPVAESEELSEEMRAREQLIFGLRMLEGIDREQFARTTGYRVHELVARPLEAFVQLGLLHDDGGRIRLTRRGLLVSDSLWPDFL